MRGEAPILPQPLETRPSPSWNTKGTPRVDFAQRSHPPSPYPHAQMAHLSLEGLRPGQPRCPVTLLMGQKGLRKGRQGFTEDSHE